MNHVVFDDAPLVAELKEVLALDDAPARAIANSIPTGAVGVLLFGSRARDDFNAESDIDILVLAPESKPSRSIGVANVSIFSPEQLRGASGTVFGAHLVRDGRVLYERKDELSTILASLTPPVFDEVLSRVRHLGSIVEAPTRDKEAYLQGLTKLSRYLCRTALYAESIHKGAPCFSVRDLAAARHNPRLESMLSSHLGLQEPSSMDLLNRLHALLVSVAGSLESFGYHSIQHLIIHAWWEDRDLATLATLTLSSTEAPLDYAALPKVLM